MHLWGELDRLYMTVNRPGDIFQLSETLKSSLVRATEVAESNEHVWITVLGKLNRPGPMFNRLAITLRLAQTLRSSSVRIAQIVQ